MSTWRVGIVSGVFFGLVMAVTSLFLGPDSTWQSVLITGLLSGVGFGVLFAVYFPRRLQKAQEQAAEGIGRFAVEPPDDQHFTRRVPASYKRSPSFAVGGALFMGPSAVVFVPHAGNLKKDRHPVPVPLSPVTDVTVVPQRLNTLQRLIVPDPPPIVRITTAAQTFDFLVTDADAVAQAVRAVLPEG